MDERARAATYLISVLWLLLAGLAAVRAPRYLNPSQSGFTAFQFGLATDVPAPADYDGDGQTDAAVFRDGTWYLRQSASGLSGVQFGLTNDTPIPAAFVP